MAQHLRLLREVALRALRKRRPWRVSGPSMEPEFHHGDLVLIDPAATAEVGDAAIAPHPYKNLDVIKYIDSIDPDGYVSLRSPGGEDSRQFGRVPVGSIRGRVTINVTATRRRR